MKICRLLALVVLSFLVIVSSADRAISAPTLYLTPENTTASTFDTLSIEIRFNMPSDIYPKGLYGASFIIDFDPLYVSIDQANFNNSFFDSAWSSVTINTNNIIFVLNAGSDLTSGPNGDFALGRIDITMTDLFTPPKETMLSAKQYSDGDNYDFIDWEGNSLDSYVSFEHAKVSAVVPIPATALLFLSGIFGLVGIRRFRGRKLEG